MTKQVQRRRGTAAQHSSFTGAEGEISVNTTNKSVHVHDGLTAGGIEAARADLANVSDADLNTALSGNTLASLTITSADINGGTIDGTVIGGSIPAAISGTTGQFGTSLNVDGTITSDGLTVDASGTPASFNRTDGNSALLELKTSGSVRGYIGADATGSTVFYSGAAAERMRIDSSGNLLVGKTSASFSTAGHELRAGAAAIFVRDGNDALSLNRLTSDGDIVKFSKDGTTVGSIGSYADKIYIGNGDTGLRFVNTSNQIRPFNTSTLADRDAGFSLGSSGARFTDLYLSGGVYLGGTGSANHLDDYEEGTFTPTVSASTGSPTYNAQEGWYTKVGRSVTVSFYLFFNKNTLSGTLSLGGLPFNSRSTYDTRAITLDWYLPSGTAAVNSVGILSQNSTNIGIRRITAANNDATAAAWTTSDISSQAYFWATFTYQTD